MKSFALRGDREPIFAGRGSPRGGARARAYAGAMELTLDLLPGRMSIVRLAPDASLPDWALAGNPASVTRTREELSIVCAQDLVPPGVRRQDGYRTLAVRGPLDFALTGIVSGLTTPLAASGVPVFVLSTFDTDLILVPQSHLDVARAALRDAGATVVDA